MQTGRPASFLERGAPNPFDGGFQASNIVEAEIKKVYVDDSNNVTFTVDVVTIKGEVKRQVPCLFPYASALGDAGLFAVPNVGDKCLVAMAAGNVAYVMGYHPSAQLQDARASASLMASAAPGFPASKAAKAQKGTFAKSQLIPGAIELRAKPGNRILLHPGGSIAIDADVDLFTFYDSISSTIESLCRSHELFTAGGSVLWEEGQELTHPSMTFQATMYTRSATKENVDAGTTRGGKKMVALFDDDHDFLIQVVDKDGITSSIKIGSSGIILSSGDGVTSGSIVLSPGGNFALIAGPQNGPHTELDLAADAIAMVAKVGQSSVAYVVANTSGEVSISGQVQVVIDAPQISLGALGGLGVVREFMDEIIVFGVQNGTGTASGFATTGSVIVGAS